MFEVPSYTDCKGMIGGKIKENGSCNPDHAHYGIVCHPYQTSVSSVQG